MKFRLQKQPRNNSHPQKEHKGKDFDNILEDATHNMPAYKRRFSAYIHSRMVWSISSILGQTIARPHALLFGAVFSFMVTIGVYLLSKNFGYSLSGFESIGSFLVGWAAGIVFDVLSALFRKKD